MFYRSFQARTYARTSSRRERSVCSRPPFLCLEKGIVKRSKKLKRRSREKHRPIRLLEWDNSIVFENHVQRCTYCGDLIKRNRWFHIRKDNGIIVAFCSRKHEAIYDKRFAYLGSKD